MPPPTTTISHDVLLGRQQSQNTPAATPTPSVIVPSTYNNLNTSPSPGAVVGIVLGSVAGLLLVLFLVYSALGYGPCPFTYRDGRRKRSRRPSHHCTHTHTHMRVRTRTRTAEVCEVHGPNGIPVPVVVASPRVVSISGEEVVMVEHEPRRH
jgi:hypothetical protein